MEIEALIREDKLLVEIPAELLERAFELGLTTGCFAKVINRQDMLHHFAQELEKSEDDSHIGRFIDMVCSDAIGDGQPFIQVEDA